MTEALVAIANPRHLSVEVDLILAVREGCWEVCWSWPSGSGTRGDGGLARSAGAWKQVSRQKVPLRCCASLEAPTCPYASRRALSSVRSRASSFPALPSLFQCLRLRTPVRG
ncbi:XRE protein [Anopheles sinensis]|uniref:XRE protein n=1 Tax=Anopheles sinensis TaxID=74873 RepID=A0A084VEH7_ANOSI|nr:XRE protein [Anopheles sinensis]